jgi:hypothetical protein
VRMLRGEVGELKDLLRTADNGNTYLSDLLDQRVGFVTEANHITSLGVLRWFDKFHIGVAIEKINGEEVPEATRRVVMYSKSSIQCIWGEDLVDGE